MMRIFINAIATFSFAAAFPFGAVAQPRNASPEHWQAVDKSMTDLLLEGYRPVSVIAPNAQRRIYFLSSGSFLAKCTEEATLAQLPPPPARLQPSAQQPGATPLPASAEQAAAQLPPRPWGGLASGPGNFAPELQVTFECSRLSKSQ
jgi:hypothetical protein